MHSPNALIIHYTSNNQIIRENEMILVDAGCEYKFVVSNFRLIIDLIELL